MLKLSYRAAAAGLSAFLLAAPALAQSGSGQAEPTGASGDYLPCSNATATVHEITPEFGYNDFDGVGQSIAGIGYSRASCLSEGSPTRWHLELNAAHVDQKGYKAEAALAGVGVSFHPFPRRPEFTIMPVARVGYENIRRGPDNFVYGGGISASDAIALSPHREDPGNGPLLVLGARVDYTNRRSSDPVINLANPRSGRTDVFGSAGIDAPAGGGWRLRGWAGYQRLDSDFLKGFATIGISARPQRGDQLTYGWNFSLSGNFGARNYRGVIFSITKRFLQPRRGGN